MRANYFEGPLKEPILDFAYDNKCVPDHGRFSGFSLVIVNENGALNPGDSRKLAAQRHILKRFAG